MNGRPSRQVKVELFHSSCVVSVARRGEDLDWITTRCNHRMDLQPVEESPFAGRVAAILLFLFGRACTDRLGCREQTGIGKLSTKKTLSPSLSDSRFLCTSASEGALPRLGMAAGLEHFIGEAVGGGDFGVHSRFGV